MKLKFDHKVTFKRCKKCGKGHDLSAIKCAKPKGIDEERETKPCTGKLEIIQFDTCEVENFDIISNKL